MPFKRAIISIVKKIYNNVSWSQALIGALLVLLVLLATLQYYWLGEVSVGDLHHQERWEQKVVNKTHQCRGHLIIDETPTIGQISDAVDREQREGDT